jgi:hypothetical protein
MRVLSAPALNENPLPRKAGKYCKVLKMEINLDNNHKIRDYSPAVVVSITTFIGSQSSP